MRGRWAFLAVMGLGCSTPTLPIAIGASEQVAYVARDQGGALRVGLTGILSGPLSFELADVEEVAFFVIPEGGLIDPEGPIDGDQSHAIRAVRGDDPIGEGCGRCLAPSSAWPQALLPGDRCPLPANAAGRLFLGEGRDLVEASPQAPALTALKSALRLSRSGPCACPDFAPTTLDGLALRLDDHPEAALPLRAMTDRADGHLYGFLPGQILHYDAATGEAELSADPLPQSLPPLASTVTPDGALVVSRKDPARPAHESSLHRLVRVDGRWQATPLSLPSTARIEVLRRPAADPHRRLFAGGVTRMVADAFTKLFRCAEDGSQCVAEFLDVPQDDELVGLEVRGDGVVHAYLSRGVYTQLRPNDAYVFRSVQGFRAFQGRQYEIRDWGRVRFGAERVVACSRLEPSGRAIVAAPYAANGAVDLDRLEITHVNIDAVGGCLGVVEHQGGFFAWLGATPTNEFLTLDALGRPTRIDTTSPIAAPIQGLFRLEQGTVYGTDQGAGGYWGATFGALQKVHGQADPELGGISTLLVDGDRVLALTDRGHLRIVQAGGTVVVPDPEGHVPKDLSITGAALDESWPGPGHSLVLAEKDGVARLNFDQQIRSFERWTPRTDAIAVAYSGPEAFVHVDRQGRISRTARGSRRELPQSFAPGPENDLFRAYLVQRGGVVWAASDEGGLYRGVGEHFEPFSSDAPSVTYGDLLMACPDRVWLTANSGDGRGVISVRTAADAPPQPELILAPIAAKPLLTILEDGADYAFLDEDGVMHRPSGADGLLSLWTPVWRAVVTPQLVVLGGGDGVLYVGRR